MYVKADELKKLFLQYEIDYNLFPDKRIAFFIENLFKGYRETIFKLFDERDNFIQSYITKNNSEPFEDENVEIFSSRKIDVHRDALK